MIRKSFLLIIIFLFSFTISCKNQQQTKSQEKNQTSENKTDDYNNKRYKIKKVVDGDTFELESGERVRLLGIDTPEKYDSKKMENDIKKSGKDKEVIKDLGVRSTLYADSLLYGQMVLLKRDSTNDDRDKYHRLLRYAYIQDTILFNLLIIKDGYAFAYIRFPFIYKDIFVQAHKEAKEKKIGLWDYQDFRDIDEL